MAPGRHGASSKLNLVRCTCPADSQAAVEAAAPPELHLRRALLLPPAEPATASLPGLGDVPLAATALALVARPHGPHAAVALIDELCRAAGSVEGGSGVPFAQLQRLLVAGCYASCVRALTAPPPASSGNGQGSGGASSSSSTMGLLQEPLSKLLAQVGLPAAARPHSTARCVVEAVLSLVAAAATLLGGSAVYLHSVH
jgi:hypothetical protein